MRNHWNLLGRILLIPLLACDQGVEHEAAVEPQPASPTPPANLSDSPHATPMEGDNWIEGGPLPPPLVEGAWPGMASANVARDAVRLRIRNLSDQHLEVEVRVAVEDGEHRPEKLPGWSVQLSPHQTQPFDLDLTDLGLDLDGMKASGSIRAILAVQVPGAPPIETEAPPAYFHPAPSAQLRLYSDEDLHATFHDGDYAAQLPPAQQPDAVLAELGGPVRARPERVTIGGDGLDAPSNDDPDHQDDGI